MKKSEEYQAVVDIISMTLLIAPWDERNFLPKRLKEDLGADSLDIGEIREELEATFKVKISAKEMKAVATISDIISMLADKKSITR